MKNKKVKLLPHRFLRIAASSRVSIRTCPLDDSCDADGLRLRKITDVENKILKCKADK
jgi:hypothetical protein